MTELVTCTRPLERIEGTRRRNEGTREGIEGAREGREMMLSGKYAFMATAEEINFLSNEECAVMEIPFDILGFKTAFGFPKTSPFIHIVNHFISKNQENGNLKRIQTKWFKDAGGHCGSKRSLDSMGFDNVISAFIMMVSGLILTFSLLCLEIWHGKKRGLKKL